MTLIRPTFLGAPLLLFRTLFFAQFMPAQGPMIEVRGKGASHGWGVVG